MKNETPSSRSVREIRRALEAKRHEIEGDLETLGDRVRQTMDLRHQVLRHPLLLGAAGLIVGFLVVRRPALVMRSLGRMAKWGAPMFISALLRPPSHGAHIGTSGVEESAPVTRD